MGDTVGIRVCMDRPRRPSDEEVVGGAGVDAPNGEATAWRPRGVPLHSFPAPVNAVASRLRTRRLRRAFLGSGDIPPRAHACRPRTPFRQAMEVQMPGGNPLPAVSPCAGPTPTPHSFQRHGRCGHQRGLGLVRSAAGMETGRGRRGFGSGNGGGERGGAGQQFWRQPVPPVSGTYVVRPPCPPSS